MRMPRKPTQVASIAEVENEEYDVDQVVENIQSVMENAKSDFIPPHEQKPAPMIATQDYVPMPRSLSPNDKRESKGHDFEKRSNGVNSALSLQKIIGVPDMGH